MKVLMKVTKYWNIQNQYGYKRCSSFLRVVFIYLRFCFLHSGSHQRRAARIGYNHPQQFTKTDLFSTLSQGKILFLSACYYRAAYTFSFFVPSIMVVFVISLLSMSWTTFFFFLALFSLSLIHSCSFATLPSPALINFIWENLFWALICFERN